MRRTKAFTLIELLVVVSIISLLVTIVLPSLGKARELARQAACAQQLGGIGKALNLYFTKERQKYPAFGFTAGTNPATTAADGFLAAPEEVDLDNNNDETAYQAMMNTGQVKSTPQAWFLLVANDLAEADIFVCPSDGDSDPFEYKTDKAGFQNWYNISYGLQPTTRDDSNKAALGRSGQKGSVCWAGDKPRTEGNAPGVSLQQEDGEYAGYSANHGDDGANFLKAGGSVGFETEEDMMVGALQDFVYGADVSSTGNVPDSPSGFGDSSTDDTNDTYLVWGTSGGGSSGP